MSDNHVWQPIETAPRDGRQILGWIASYYRGAGGPELILWQDNAWWDMQAREQKPTHWQPLPPPPAGESEKT